MTKPQFPDRRSHRSQQYHEFEAVLAAVSAVVNVATDDILTPSVGGRYNPAPVVGRRLVVLLLARYYGWPMLQIAQALGLHRDTPKIMIRRVRADRERYQRPADAVHSLLPQVDLGKESVT